MNRPGPGPQPLRSIAGNVFQNPPSTTSARTTLGSGRLQNGKLANGSTSGWGYMGGAPGLSQQPRTNNPGLPNFAQTLGGSHNHASLDPSEFPSLSGGPQSQTSQSQAIWGNSNARSTQPAPVARPQPQNGGQPNNAQSSSQSSQSQSHRPDDSQGSPFPQHGGGLEDYRFSDQGGLAHASRTSDHQGGSDDFPPLGGLGGADLQIRRAGSGQDSRYNGAGNNAFEARNRILGQLGSHQDGALSTGATPTSRSPLEQEQERLQRQEQIARDGQNAREKGDQSQASYSANLSIDQQQQYAAYHQHGDVPPSHSHAHEQMQSSMTELDRYGLDGLMATLRGENPDQQSIALGMDLNTLGLDLSRSDNSPLYRHFAGPFSEPVARPIIPDFNLPPAYTVMNVPPLSQKIGSFSDETLFIIFYQNPRDVAQELAATELYSRDWRWHKKLQQWMMKAKEYGEPMTLQSGKEERGYYYFFNVNTWARDRKEFILNYDHLHHGQPLQPGSSV